MRSLKLDFVERPRFSLSRVALVLLGLMLVIACYQSYRLKEAEKTFIRKKSDALEQAKRRTKFVPTPEFLARQKDISTALQRLAFPWSELFEGLEAPSNESVVLLEMHPNVERSLVVLTGEAKDFDAIAQYVEELEEQKVFHNVYLASHQVQEQNPLKPVRFEVRAEWRLSLIGNKQ